MFLDEAQIIRVKPGNCLGADELGLRGGMTKLGKPLPIDVDIAPFSEIKDVDRTGFGVQYPCEKMLLFLQLQPQAIALADIANAQQNERFALRSEGLRINLYGEQRAVSMLMNGFEYCCGVKQTVAPFRHLSPYLRRGQLGHINMPQLIGAVTIARYSLQVHIENAAVRVKNENGIEACIDDRLILGARYAWRSLFHVVSRTLSSVPADTHAVPVSQHRRMPFTLAG